MAPSAMVLLIRVAFSFSLCLGGGKASITRIFKERSVELKRGGSGIRIDIERGVVPSEMAK